VDVTRRKVDHTERLRRIEADAEIAALARRVMDVIRERAAHVDIVVEPRDKGKP
jgi:hypothetical protein